MISCDKADLEVGKAGGRGKDRQEVCAAKHYVLAMKGGGDRKARGVCGVTRILINLYSVALWAFVISQWHTSGVRLCMTLIFSIALKTIFFPFDEIL